MPYVEYTLTGGLETKAPADRIADGQLQRARGCVYDTLGAVLSDQGRRELLNVGGGVIRGEGDATLNGKRRRFSKAGTTVYRDALALGTFGVAAKPLSVVPYNAYVYLADGEVFRRYSLDKGLEEVGLDAPDTTGLGVAFSGSGQGLSAGDYKWAWTYYNGVAESNFSEPITGTAAAGEKADVDVPVTWPASATEARLYRTLVGGSAYFRVSETTTAGGTLEDTGGVVYNADPDASESDDVTDEPRREDTIRPPGLGQKQGRYQKQAKLKSDYSDAQVTTGEIVQTNLGILGDWNDHDKPPETIKHIRFVGERVFGIEGNNLRFTLVTAPEHWSEYNSVPIGRQTGETLLAVEPYGPDVICYTDSGIWRFRPLGLDATESQLIQTESQVGLAAEYAVTSIDSGLHVFLGQSGVYVFDGREAKEISFAAEKLFTDPGHIDYIGNKANAVAGSLRDKVWISYSTGGETNNRTLFIDLQDPQSPKFSVLLYGFSTLRRNLDNKLIGGGYDGKLYVLGENVEAEEDITLDVTTKDFPFAGSTQMESYDRLVVDADLGGVDTAVTVKTNTGKGVTFTMNWLGRKRVKRWLPAELTGQRASVTFFSVGAEPRTIYGCGFGVEAEDEP